jgi:hypothetical protein
MPVDVKPSFRKELISIDVQNSVLKLNYAFSSFTSDATLQIKDFTGRTLKSFNVNTLDTAQNQFAINELLSGVYKYVLIVEHQNKIAGDFTLVEY